MLRGRTTSQKVKSSNSGVNTEARRTALHKLHSLSHSVDINNPRISNGVAAAGDPRLAALRLHSFIKELSSELEIIETMETGEEVNGADDLGQAVVDNKLLEEGDDIVASGRSIDELNEYKRTMSEESDWSKFEKMFSKDLLPTVGSEKETGDFLMELIKLLFDYIHRNNDRSKKVLDFHHPHQLLEMMDHCLELPCTQRPLEQILSDCKETLKYCVKTGHPRFFNQLSTGLDVIALAGEFLTATTNTNMFTYEIAPVFTLMESLLLSKMRSVIGWEEGDGIFAPGGAICNLYAVLTARYYACPEVKSEGLYGLSRLVLYTSEHTHFSFKKAAAVMGHGMQNVITVPCDERGKMMPRALEAAIQTTIAEGGKPFFVVATGGTTVLGAFDPILEIEPIARKYGLWLHVDTAWGGGCLMSSKRRRLLAGIEKADSVTWNPHKMMGVSLQCSAFLTRHLNLMAACNSASADYLFQQDKNYDVSYDTGDKSIQCGRHNDAFKFWLMWRAKGDEGFEAQIEHYFMLANYLRKLIRENEGFEFVLENAECTNVCFWYVPTMLRCLPRDEAFNNKLDKVAPRIKALMMEKGSTMVNYQPLDGKPNFFRMVFSNAASRTGDIDWLVDEIRLLGESITASEFGLE